MDSRGMHLWNFKVYPQLFLRGQIPLWHSHYGTQTGSPSQTIKALLVGLKSHVMIKDPMGQRNNYMRVNDSVPSGMDVSGSV